MSFYHLLKKLYFTLLKVKNRLLIGRPVLVLMYHRINDEVGEQLTGLTVSPENFEKQLLYFKKHFQILRLEENWTSLKKTGVVITFDDGYADNIINALPLLEKYQIPATIFITTLNINTKNEFWWDRLVFDYSNCQESFYLPDQSDKISKSNSSYKYITGYVHKMRNEDKEKWFLEFEKINKISFYPREEYRSLADSELKLLSEHPLITLGIHTHNHYSLGALSYDVQKQEISFSIEKLKEFTTKIIKYLALPNGSYNTYTLKITEELNLEGFLLANDYYSNIKNKHSKKINRILMPNIEGEKLVKCLKKFDW
ncbi:polysaccharide deacetylase family protein [Flavobacterium sp. WC2509]|uniref:polysaccharide deacetylase family protein n=1 Tax=Flavobacterium sp. WC2509 TaxID=3461406 RepID=UPI004044058E